MKNIQTIAATLLLGTAAAGATSANAALYNYTSTITLCTATCDSFEFFLTARTHAMTALVWAAMVVVAAKWRATRCVQTRRHTARFRPHSRRLFEH